MQAVMVIIANVRCNRNCKCDYGGHKVTIEFMFINQSGKSFVKQNNVGIVEKVILRGFEKGMRWESVWA